MAGPASRCSQRPYSSDPADSLTGVLATALAAGEVPSVRGLSGFQLTERWALGSGQEGRGSARPEAHSQAKAQWGGGGERLGLFPEGVQPLFGFSRKRAHLTTRPWSSGGGAGGVCPIGFPPAHAHRGPEGEPSWAPRSGEKGPKSPTRPPPRPPVTCR